MFLSPQKTLQTSGITSCQLLAIRHLLLGHIYHWINTHGESPFTASHFVGGSNRDWSDTPLIVLYDKHIAQGKTPDEAQTEAGKDLGRILKLVLAEDPLWIYDLERGWKSNRYHMVRQSHIPLHEGPCE